MTCLQSFLLGNVTIVLPLCLFRWWHALMLSPLCQHQYAEIPLQTVGSRFLSSIDEGNPTPSTHSHYKYWPFSQHRLWIDDICFDNIVHIFNNRNIWLQLLEVLIWTFNFCSYWISIVVLACSWVLRNKSIIWFLFNALSVSSVYTLAITSTRLLQLQKIVVK